MASCPVATLLASAGLRGSEHGIIAGHYTLSLSRARVLEYGLMAGPHTLSPNRAKGL